MLKLQIVYSQNNKILTTNTLWQILVYLCNKLTSILYIMYCTSCLPNEVG